MKFSIFKKVALWLLIIISAVEIIMFAVLYTYTYNKAVAEATGDIREAAKSASEQISFYDPNALTKRISEKIPIFPIHSITSVNNTILI